MKRIQCCMSFVMAFLLLSATSGIEGCGTKDSSPAAVVQQPPADSSAQDPSAQQQPATQTAQPASTDQSQPQAQAQPQAQLPPVNLTADGLDELLAPVALYPDPVLAVLLQASVDPQEVMDGGNWLVLPENQNLKEAALDQASSKAGFTPVMQALLHYPTVVDLMCQQFDWTKQLGAAYQGDPKAVLASVQRLRAQADDNGALKSSPQMTVDVKQDQGREVVELKPTDPKVVYIPQYDPSRVYSTTTTTTSPSGYTTTTTTSSAPAASTSSSTVVVQQQSSGVSTGTAVAIGLLSFGAGIAVGMAINNNNYYYPAWGYGGVYYGPRPYYPPPYRPIYYPGYGGGYHYNRPVHYGNNNIYINNNNNYYNRFNNNNNLNSNYKPKPVPYNRNNPNSTYARSMGNNPGGNKGVNYRPPANNNASNFKGQGTYQGNQANRPANNGNASANTRPATGNIQNRPPGANPGNNPNSAQRPAAANNANNNWKGQTTYQGNKGASANAGANNRVATGNSPARNPSGDRGFGQTGGTRPTTSNTPAARPATGNTPAARPATGNSSASRPAQNNPQPAARPAPQQANRQQQPSSNGGAFGGASNPKSDRAASNRGQASMGSTSKPNAAAGRKK